MAGKQNKNVFFGIILAVIVAVAGAGYYFTKGKPDGSSAESVAGDASQQAQQENNDVSDVETAAGNTADESASVPNPMSDDGTFVVEPGNPIVAKVDGKDITRVDVYRFIQTMPANIQELPASAVYPMAMDQVINTRIVQNKADAADVTDSDEFKRELEAAKQQLARNIYLQQQVDSKISESNLKSAYNDYIKKLPDLEERSARHILVDTKEKADAVIAKLKSGEDFQELAKSLSIGPTAANGGNLGYFTKQEMVPEFANAAFSMDKNSILDNPVKTQFGWHVIQLLDVRNRAKPTFEQMEPMIRAEQRREILAELLDTWRKDAKIEQFDINGKPLKEGADATGMVPAKQPADQQGG